MRNLFVIAVLILCSLGIDAQSDDRVIAGLKVSTQKLMDAVAPGKTEVWQELLADNALYSDEEGNIKTKADMLKELRPLPAGYVGSIKVGEPRVIDQGGTIVLIHRDREQLDLYGQTLITMFQSTDTWVRQSDGRWQIVSIQVMAIPSERKPITLDAARLDTYTGVYQLTPDNSYTVTREGDKLFGQRSGRAKEELLPLYDGVFYRRGVWRGEKVFEKDAAGKVINMFDRRDNNDLVWKKIK